MHLPSHISVTLSYLISLSHAHTHLVIADVNAHFICSITVVQNVGHKICLCKEQELLYLLMLNATNSKRNLGMWLINALVCNADLEWRMTAEMYYVVSIRADVFA